MVIVIVLCWWILGVYNATYPGPSVPDSDFSRLIEEFESYPKELWLRGSECEYNKWLLCRPYRFIVFESNGEVIYDSSEQDKWQYKFPVLEKAKKLPISVEYIRAAALTQGVALRKACAVNSERRSRKVCGDIANIAELVKDGDFYRIVHISEYVYSRCDDEF